MDRLSGPKDNKRSLLIISEDTVYFDGRIYSSVSPLVRLFANLKDTFSEVTLSAPSILCDRPPKGYVEHGLQYSLRPYYGSSFLGFLKSSLKAIRPTLYKLNAAIVQADVIMIRVPSPVSYFACRIANKQLKPYCLFVSGDVRRASVQGQHLLKRLAISLVAQFVHWTIKRMAKNRLVFVCGSELFKEFSLVAQRCVNFIPSVISNDEIFYREDTCINDCIKLLYVGRLTTIKGLPFLLHAVRYLLDKAIKVQLQLVGSGEQQDYLKHMVKKLSLDEYVEFKGYIPFSDELLEFYRRADIFVLPSLSEGIPKTLFEAMASGLPIVATKVGGVSDVIKHGETGLLIEPKSSTKLAQAIELLASDGALRRRLIQNGYALVREYTVERQAKKLSQEIANFLL